MESMGSLTVYYIYDFRINLTCVDSIETQEENYPDVDDMISLADLSEVSILANLGNRYVNKQKIYVYSKV